MGSIGKGFSLLLVIVLAVSSLIMIESAYAQSIPKPSVPEFNVTLIDSSYDIPPSSTVNPFNGQVINEAGRHVESRTIQLSVKNQPFTPFTIKEQIGDRTVYLHYEIHWKGHFEKDWHQKYYPYDEYAMLTVEDAQLKTEYSVFSYKGDYSSAGWNGFGPTLPPDSQIDFQVKAFIGYISYNSESSPSGWTFIGETSDWSDTQTITIGETSSASPTPNPTPTPTVPEFSLLAIITLFTAVTLTSLFMLTLRKHQVKIASISLTKKKGFIFFYYY